MEGDQASQGAPPADDSAAGASPTAQSQGGEPGGQSPTLEEQSASVNDAIRSAALGSRSTLKPPETDASGESAPQGDVKPEEPVRGADGRFVPRRGVPEAAKVALREEVRAELLAEQQQATEHAKLDEMSKTREADVARYRTLIETPDARLSADDYAWREDFKEKLELIPEVVSYHQELTRQEIATRTAELSQKQTDFWGDVKGQMGRLSTLPGVDGAAYEKLGNFEQMGGHLWEAGRASGRAELADENRRLADENRQLRQTGPRGLAAARSGLPGGRSSVPAPTDMNQRLFGAWRGQAPSD